MKLNLVLLLFVLTTTLSAQAQRIIPQPGKTTINEGSFSIPNAVLLYANDLHLYKVVAFTEQTLLQDFGITSKVTTNKKEKNSIQLLLEPHHKDVTSESNKEGYSIIVNKEGIKITAATEAGIFYGIQSLRQLIKKENIINKISYLKITDAPRFAWRAFMLDEGRFFKGKEEVKKLLDEMARLKMNVFHWHLVDDQGWRIEIKKYPLLTAIGSKRKSTQVGPLKWQSPIQSGVPHSGFYTQEDIKEIVAYASDRFITVVPEIEMPGHSSAAIAAYPWLGSVGAKIEVPIKFGVSKDVYNITDPKVYSFLTDVLDEVITLFPSKVIHIGGDEVKYDHWKNNKGIQDYMKKNNLNTPADLQIHFTNRISQYLSSKGRRMMGWNEILGDKLHEYQSKKDTEVKEKLATTSVIHFWKGDLQLFNKAAQNGFSIVNSLHTNTYLDYSYKSIPLEKAYSFDPIPEGLAPEFHKNVMGLGCQMWGEWIPTSGYMDYMIFPRIAAYAEVGWTPTDNLDYTAFKKSLQNILEIWKEKEIYYAPLEEKKKE